MNKNESLAFLEKCIDMVNTVTEEEIEILQKIYSNHCTESDVQSLFEFLAPSDVGNLFEESIYSNMSSIPKKYIIENKNNVNYHSTGKNIKNTQDNDNAAYAA